MPLVTRGSALAHPIIFMWTVPRSVSTSFERMMSERGDHAVLDEPFSRHYYFGPDRRSTRFSRRMDGCSASSMRDLIERTARQRPVFVKDMAYQATGMLDPARLAGFRNCFLVRDPAATLRSLARRWPDFTDEETGWEALGRAADVVQSVGQPLVVLEAERLCADPRAVVAAWCEAMHLEFVEDALTWDAGMRPEWSPWEDWHTATARATGFIALDEPPPPRLDDSRVYEAYRRALPVYERLRAHVLTV
jgi:Sulfotransferase domain